MADGPLTRGLLGGANLLQQSQAQDIQRQQLIQTQQAQKQKQATLDLENADKLLDLGFATGNVELVRKGTDIYNTNLGTTFDADVIFEKGDDFKKRKKAIMDFANLPEIKTNPNLQTALRDELIRANTDFSGQLGIPEGQVEGLEGVIPETPETITSEKLIDDPSSPTGNSVVLLDKQGNLVKKLRNATEKDVKGKPLVTVNTGDLQAGTKTQIEKDILASDRTIGQLNRAESTFKPEFLTIGGKVKGGIQRLSEKAGFETDTEFLAEKARWFNQAKQAFFVYRKWVTGVAGGEKEMKDIATAFPDPVRNSPTEYLANLKETRLWQRAVKKWLIETKALGLSISETREILPELGVGGEFETEGVSPEDEANAFLEG